MFALSSIGSIQDIFIYLAPIEEFMKVLVEAYGCTLNRGEAQEFQEGLLARGHELVEGEQEAEAFVIFTCGVIETTERHMLKRIGYMAGYPEKKLMVCGCLGAINPDAIKKVAPNAVVFHAAEQALALDGFEFLESPTVSSKQVSAVGILPISTGCIGSCTYCITRKARGMLVSRSPGEIASRLEGLVGTGRAEIQLCAQDTAIYGQDIGTDLKALVQRLETVPGNYMMRIGMMNPANVKEQLHSILEAYDSPRVFKFLHLPAQSGSDSVLQGMGRNHTAADFAETVGAFRSRFPELALSTDIIVGFPGETDDDFEASIELVKVIRPDIINITRFSARPGTAAAEMTDKVPGGTAKERSRQLTGLRFAITGENYNKYMGQTVSALATERRKPGSTFLRTVDYRPVVVDRDIDLGKWHTLEITGASKTHLVAVLND